MWADLPIPARLPYDGTLRKSLISGTLQTAMMILLGQHCFAFASKLTDSFAKYRWCANIIGPQGGGAVEDLPLYQYEAMGRGLD